MENRIGTATTSRTDTSQADEALRRVRASRTVLKRFPAGGPRGSWPAEEFAAARRAEGLTATVVMDITNDEFKVVTA